MTSKQSAAAGRVTAADFFGKQLSMIWVGIAVVVLAVFLTASWRKAANDPRQVFWDMLAQNLSTPGVTVHMNQSSGSSGAQELVQFGFGAVKQARTATKLTRNGTAVTTQSLELPGKSYVQYADIVPAGASAKSVKKSSFAGVVGVWADTSAANSSPGDKGVPPIFGQVLLGLSMPFGNLAAAPRAALLQEIRQNAVYVTSFAHTKKQMAAGRPQYVYTVQIEPAAYVKMMQDFGDDMGMHELDQLDPGSYVSQAGTTVTWTVDVHSRQLIAVTYEASGRHETYDGYGIPLAQSAPAKPISAATLQARLSGALN